MSDQHPTAAPGDPRPEGSSPYGPGAGAPQPSSAVEPYAQPYPNQPYPNQPYPGQPYPGQPYAADPYGQPYAAQPYADPYGQPAYAAPGYASAAGPAFYGTDPLTGVPWSTKTKATAGLLQLLLPLVGVCGVGRLYAGQVGIGLAQLLGFLLGCALMVLLVGFLIAPAVWLWAVVDGIVLLTTGGRDQFGRPLR